MGLSSFNESNLKAIRSTKLKTSKEISNPLNRTSLTDAKKAAASGCPFHWFGFNCVAKMCASYWSVAARPSKNVDLWLAIPSLAANQWRAADPPLTLCHWSPRVARLCNYFLAKNGISVSSWHCTTLYRKPFRNKTFMIFIVWQSMFLLECFPKYEPKIMSSLSDIWRTKWTV